MLNPWSVETVVFGSQGVLLRIRALCPSTRCSGREHKRLHFLAKAVPQKNSRTVSTVVWSRVSFGSYTLQISTGFPDTMTDVYRRFSLWSRMSRSWSNWPCQLPFKYLHIQHFSAFYTFQWYTNSFCSWNSVVKSFIVNKVLCRKYNRIKYITLYKVRLYYSFYFDKYSLQRKISQTNVDIKEIYNLWHATLKLLYYESSHKMLQNGNILFNNFAYFRL